MNAAHRFAAENLVSGYDKKTVVKGVCLAVPDKKISAIVGANACGKSTLLKTMARLIKPISGNVTLDGRPVSKIPPKRFAASVGLLPQSPIVPEGISVANLVGRGRYPHQKLLRGWTAADFKAVAEAMDFMGVGALADANIDELSGGQRQRVWIAMALAQQTDILFLDEPTTFLDITYQIEILDLLTDLNRRRGTTIVMVLHDVNLAARYADRIFALRDGVLFAEGPPREIVTPDLIREVFGLDCVVIDSPVFGTPLVVPKSRRAPPDTAE
jgi:iron complex transport system ATP-binding protein